MSVELLDTPRFHGYRVRRQINGKTYQEYFSLKQDGKLEAMPVPDGTPPTAYARAYSESALRAIIECQPYNLPAQFFEEWKSFTPVFQERPV